MSWYRFLMENLHSFWRKVCVALRRESTDHQSLGWTEIDKVYRDVLLVEGKTVS